MPSPFVFTCHHFVTKNCFVQLFSRLGILLRSVYTTNAHLTAGVIAGDCGGTIGPGMTEDERFMAITVEEARLALAEGNRPLGAALVREGIVPSGVVDEAARRVLRLKVMLGLFEQPYTDEALTEEVILRAEYRAKALEVAQKSMVLLRNEGGLLPLGPEMGHVALIGPLADDHHHILGCWYRIGRDEDTESVLDGLRAVLPPDTRLAHVRGCDLEGSEEPDLERAASAAGAADVAILVLGEGEHMSGEAHSRAHLGLPGHQQAMLEVVHATGTPVVVVLMSGRPLAVPWMASHVAAIVQAWHGGIRAGRAVADI